VNARAVLRASTWAAVGVAGSKALSLVTSIALARFVAPADFGVVALASVAVELASLVQDFGLSPALVQHRGDARGAAIAVRGLHLRTTVALVLVLEAGAGPVARLLGMAGAEPVLRGLALVLPLRALGLVPRALLQRAMRFRALATAEVAGLLARALVAVPLAAAGAGVWSLVVGYLVAPLVQSAVARVACGRLPAAAAEPDGARAALLRFARPMTLASVAVWARDGLTRILVGVLLGPAELGYFHMAARIAAVPITGITHVSNRVALPIYAATSDPAALRRAFLATLGVVGTLALPVCAGLLAVAPEAVAVAFGPAWAPIVAPLRILLVASVVSSLAATVGELFKALGRPQDLLRTGIPHLVLLLVAVPLGARGGLAGVAAAIAAVRIAMATLGLGLASARLALRPAALAGAIAPAAVATAVVLGAVALVPDLGGAAPTLASRVAAGAAAYGLALLAWRRARPARGDDVIAREAATPRLQ
jgi:O-antigen/teichoic acid export membrane protein